MRVASAPATSGNFGRRIRRQKFPDAALAGHSRDRGALRAGEPPLCFVIMRSER